MKKLNTICDSPSQGLLICSVVPQEISGCQNADNVSVPFPPKKYVLFDDNLPGGRNVTQAFNFLIILLVMVCNYGQFSII